jgi:hypothetical protein
MNNTCPACNQLLKHHDGEAHIGLKLISKLPGSHLFKCNQCQSYLHYHQNVWEMLLEGLSQNQKPLVHVA